MSIIVEELAAPQGFDSDWKEPGPISLPDVEDNDSNEHGFGPEKASGGKFEGIIGRSAAINELRRQIKLMAPTDSTVLILGETGTGKELVARAIHNLSPRRGTPFVRVNCAAIPAGLIESELFGHERGAFTGALSRRVGRFEMADGGTLFLDEIGDIPRELQPKLLRVLQEREFERLGGMQTIRVDVRVVAATSRDLRQMVATREFRADLFFRLNVLPLRLPALRDRSEDIPVLVRHFVDQYAKRMNKRVATIPLVSVSAVIDGSLRGIIEGIRSGSARAEGSFGFSEV